MANVLQTLYDNNRTVVDTIILGAVLSTPHALYRYVWENPSGFTKKCEKVKKDPVVVIASTGACLKAVQYAACFIWLYRTFQDENGQFILNLHDIPRGLTAIAFSLITFGQVLNISTYKALKWEGIYYGAKLGKTIPWVHGFPFNTFNHPQYLGCVCTVWGATLLVLGTMHFYRWMHVLSVGTWWTLLYVFSSMVESESRPRSDKNQAKSSHKGQ
eukprot:CFRG4983T1